MNEDFEKWLGSKGLLVKYANNPECRKELLIAYLTETEADVLNKPKEWADWARNYPKEASKHTPKTMAVLRELSGRQSDFKIAMRVKNIVDSFDTFKAEINKYTGQARVELALDRYFILTNIEEQYLDRPVIRDTIRNMSRKITEQLEFCLTEMKESSEEQHNIVYGGLPSNNENDSGENLNNEMLEHFGFMRGRDPRKNDYIMSEQDFGRLMRWVSEYFDNNLTLPEIENPIRLVKTNKGNITYTFKRFYRYKYPRGVFPDSLFELIKRCFHQFKDDNIKSMKKTSEPQYYEELIKK